MLAYLHIPFCDSKCHYCAFNSYVDKFNLQENYMIAITQQLAFELERFNAPKESITSLFIGGGTPSTIKANLFAPFFTTIKPFLAKDVEITTEANPNSASYEWLKEMKNFGVNRVSFGVQSFNEEKLKFLGRNHSSKAAIQAIENASKLGIENISLDLIYGTFGDNIQLLEDDLAIASSLPINHLSAYALTIEENTPFFSKKNVVNNSEKLAKEFVQRIIQKGFPAYEISNFGTYQSRHNKGYWEHEDYIGVGSGAVGFLRNQRFYPSKDIKIYIDNPLAFEVELLTHEDLHVEKIFLGLRSMIGIELSIFSPKEMQKVTLLIAENKLTCKEEKVYNNDYFLSDEVALFITD